MVDRETLTLVDLVLPVAGQVVTAADIQGANALVPRGRLRGAPRELLGRLQWSMSKHAQPWVFGSCWFNRPVSDDHGADILRVIDYCEYDSRGERHGYHFRRRAVDENDRIGTETLWSFVWHHGQKICRINYDRWGGGKVTRRYSNNMLHEAVLSNNTRTEYRAGQPHGKQVAYDQDGRVIRCVEYRHGSELRGSYYKWIEVDGRTVIGMKMTQEFRDGIPSSVTLYQSPACTDVPSLSPVSMHFSTTRALMHRFPLATAEFVGKTDYAGTVFRGHGNRDAWMDYRDPPDDGDEPAALVNNSTLRTASGGRLVIRSLVDLTLPAVGKIITRDMLGRIPRELCWRLQCATPPVNQPAVFGSATWIYVYDHSTHLVRRWQQHDPLTGCRHGMAARWLVGKYVADETSVVMDVFRPTYLDGMDTDPYYMLTHFGPSMGVSWWRNNLRHGPHKYRDTYFSLTSRYRDGVEHGLRMTVYDDDMSYKNYRHGYEHGREIIMFTTRGEKYYSYHEVGEVVHKGGESTTPIHVAGFGAYPYMHEI